MQKIKTDGAEVCFTTFTPSAKDLNKWVTLINGYMRPQSDFKQMARALTGQGYHVLTLDNRGVGDTSITRPFSVQDMCEDVRKIWDALEISQSSLVGVSMGGIISQTLAARFINRVRHLALVSTLQDRAFFSSSDAGMPKSVPEMLEYLRPYVAHTFFERNRLLMEAMAKQMVQKQQAITGSAELQGSLEQRKALRSWLPIQKQEADEWTGKIKVGIFHGREDGIISVESALSMSSFFPSSDLHLYGESGHLLIAEKSKIFYQDLITFLTS